jgi:hypothetical protein
LTGIVTDASVALAWCFSEQDLARCPGQTCSAGFDQWTLGPTPFSLMAVDEICDELFYIKGFYSAGDGLRGQG